MLKRRIEITDRWKPVPGFEKYEVSDTGKVRSLMFREPRELRPYTHPTGHQEVKLRRDGKSVGIRVHVLVALAFIGCRPKGLNVCHNNGNASDNRLQNLRYDTQKSNIQDSVAQRTHRNSRKTHCIRNHEFNKENTIINPDGSRRCRECRKKYV